MDRISFKVAEFEGPLDLILHLISKNKLNIYDLSISSLLDQYMDYISTLKEKNLDIASEFLDMASRLIHIKTLSLLPKYEEEEKKERAELVGQLIEYQACKAVAARLSEMAANSLVFVRGQMELEEDRTYRLTHDPELLLAAYADAAGKGKRRMPPPQAAFSQIVARPVVSVSSRIMFIMRRLYKGCGLTFGGLFKESTQKSEMVATFLAVLELIKAKRISVEDEHSQIVFHRQFQQQEPDMEGR